MTLYKLVRRAAATVLPAAVIAWSVAPIYAGAESLTAPQTNTAPQANTAPQKGPVQRHWTAAHQAFAGPLLDAEWFAKRRVVVYLMPANGNYQGMREAATVVMRDRWLEGDWSLKHLVVSDVGRVRFSAQQRLAVREIAEEMTKEAGQEPDFVSENENYVRDQVFFLHDPARDVWKELLGEQATGREAAVVMLDYGGKVVRVLNVDEALRPVESAASNSIQTTEPSVVLEVRKDLPFRPDFGG
jgi:hypothetical protein